MNKIKFILLSLILVSSLAAQDLSKLTPDQLDAYKKYIAGKGAVNTNNTSTTKENVVERTVEMDSTITNPKLTTNTNLKASDTENAVFGSQLFSSQNLTFEPKLNIPTPPKYILGTYDELIIDISGLYEANYKIKVTPEGTIRIPNVGSIKVTGLTMEDASRIIKNRISGIYMGVSSGQTRVNITLGNIRSIRITVVGEAVRPGTYTMPSLATVFNALYAAGGPSIFGSMRDIKVIRSGKTVASIDVYRFLLDGVLINNISLQDEDVIKIESYKVRATIKGAVKHNGIFEALNGETLQDLIRFAGGFTDNAYKQKITVIRLTEKEKTIVDIIENRIPTFLIQSGDSFVVSTTLNKFDNRIDIKGSVYRPGPYALEPGLTVRQLIAKADGVKEDAYLNMAYITRKKDNQIPEIVGFNLGEVLLGRTPDILLQKDDQIEVRSLFDYREGQSVSIWGAVKSPGTFPLIENITLKDLIFKARGFTEMASTDSVELVRIIKDKETLLNTDQKTIVYKFTLDKDLNFAKGSGDMLLENGDQVIVRNISGYEPIRMVRVEGEVFRPGNYNITNKSERISDLIKRAGGFNQYAYPGGAYLVRYEKTNGVEGVMKQKMIVTAKKQVNDQKGKSIDASLLKSAGVSSIQQYSDLDSIQQKLSGSGSIEETLNPNEGIIGINLTEIMHNPTGSNDLSLEDGDVVFIPRELQTIRVLGEVLFPTYVRYETGKSLRNYISSAGGFSERAQKRKVFVLYANGSAKSTKSFLGFIHYPPIKPGSRIVIPEKPVEIKNKLSVVETVSIMSSIVTVTTLLYSVLKK